MQQHDEVSPPAAPRAGAPCKVAAWCRALRLNFRPLSLMGYALGALLAPEPLRPGLFLLGYLALFAMQSATVLAPLLALLAT
jgi:hypothetical protein